MTAEPIGDPAAAETVAARVVVGADGPRSIVARGRRHGPRRRCSRAASGSRGTSRTSPATGPRGPDGRAARRRVLRPRAGAGRPGERRHRARRARVAGAARRPTARPRSGRPCSRRSRRSTASPRRGARARSPTRSRAPARSAAGSRGGPGPAGCSSATRPGSSTRSPARGCTGRSVVRPARGGGDRRAPARPRRRRPRRLRPRDGRPVRAPRTSSRCSSRRSSPGPRCSSTPAGGSRAGTDVRATMGLVMGDLVPASRALDPRFLAALLRPVTRRDRGRRRDAGRASPPTPGSSGDDAGPPVPDRGPRLGAGAVDPARRRPRVRRGPGRRRPPRAARGDRARRRLDGLLGVRSAVLEPERRQRGHRIHAIGIVYRVERSSAASSATRSTARPTCAAWIPFADLGRAAVGRARRARRASGAAADVRSTIGIDIAAPPELVYRAGPRRHPLGAAAPPLRAVGGGPRRAATARWSCDFVARRPFVPVLGLGIPVTWRSRDLARAGDPPPAVRPRRGATKGMDVTWTIEPSAPTAAARGSRSSTTSAPRPGLGRVRGPLVHPADRGPDAGDVRGARRGDRATTSTAPAMTRLSDAAPGVHHRHRRPVRDRHRPAGVPGRPARRAQPVKRIDRFDPSRLPRRRSRPQVDDFDPLDHMDARSRPGRSTGSASSGWRPAGWRWRTRGSCPARAGAPRRSGSGSTSGRRWAASRSPRCSTSSTSSAASGPSPRPSRSRCSAARRRPTSASRSTSAGRSCRPRTRAPRARSRSARRSTRSATGEIDAAIAGGVEVPLSPLAFGAFDIIRALGHGYNDDPRARRPADGRGPRRVRHGRGRGAARPRGGGHRPRPAARRAVRGGAGLRRDLGRPPHGPAATRRPRGRRARSRSRSRTRASAPDEIDWVSAHASSTPIGDIAEARAIARALGDRAATVPVSARRRR